MEAKVDNSDRESEVVPVEKLVHAQGVDVSLPISIKNIIKGSSIESSRLEYIEGWDPESVLHTICAFANDIEECGGGT